jgi:hypothetical protein
VDIITTITHKECVPGLAGSWVSESRLFCAQNSRNGMFTWIKHYLVKRKARKIFYILDKLGFIYYHKYRIFFHKEKQIIIMPSAYLFFWKDVRDALKTHMERVPKDKTSWINMTGTETNPDVLESIVADIGGLYENVGDKRLSLPGN